MSVLFGVYPWVRAAAARVLPHSPLQRPLRWQPYAQCAHGPRAFTFHILAHALDHPAPNAAGIPALDGTQSHVTRRASFI